MPSDTPPDPLAALLLVECAVIISSFRNRNAASGYQLREPPGTDTILSRIDKFVHADEKPPTVKPELKRKRREKADPGYQVQRAAIPRLAR